LPYLTIRVEKAANDDNDVIEDHVDRHHIEGRRRCLRSDDPTNGCRRALQDVGCIRPLIDGADARREAM
jgi:hypothetical protein